MKYYGSVQESDPAGTSVLQIRATDADIGDAGEIRYFITQGSDQRFEIDERTGWITTTRKLDKSIKSVFRISVTARDQQSKFSPNMAELEINVMDGTEQLPVFLTTR